MAKLAPLTRVSVSARVFGGFGVIMALLALVSAISGIGMRSVEQSVGPVGAASTVMSVVGDFTAKQLEVAVQVNAYAASERVNDLEKLKSALAALADSRKTLSAAPLASQERELVDALTKRTIDYEAIVDRSEKAITERKEAGDELTSVGAAATNAVSALVVRLERENQSEQLSAGVRLAQSLQGTLVAGTRYLISGNPGDLDSSKTELDRFTRDLSPIKEATAASERIQKLVKALEDTLPKLKASLARIDAARNADEALEKERRRASAELGELAAKLRDIVTVQQHRDLAGMDASVALADRLGLGFSGAALALGLCLAWVIGRGIAKPIKGITATMKRMAEGDYEISVGYNERADEIGEMARTVEVFRRNGIEVRTLHADQEAAKHEAERQRKAALETMAERFETTVKGIVDAVSASAAGMQQTASRMSSTATKTQQSSTIVASASQQASANVQTVASAAEELSASIMEIGRQATQASQAIANASAEGKRTDATVTALTGAAQKIGEVVSLINEIASQTNLLALNATIEAARAGEAGKGFAVVASEVKTLATQTAKATGDIRAQIQAIQAETQTAVTAIRGICASIIDVNQISASISAAVEEQTSATHEIARSVKEAASGTNQVSEHIETVTTDARKTGTAASEVLQAAGALSQQAEQLRSEVDKFIATVRAA